MKTFRKIFLAIIALAVMGLAGGTAAADTLTVDADGGTDFTSIQEAVDSAKEGDTILVMPGKYVENVHIGKPLNIISGVEAPEEIVVEAADRRDHVFHIRADNVNISGFTLQGAKYEDNLLAGIYLDNVQKSTIQGNILLDNYYGIYLKKSRENLLNRNVASNNKYGILLCVSSGENILSMNRISDNYYGVDLENACNNNILTGNTVYSNRENGVMVISSSCTDINNNNISLNPKTGLKLDNSRGNSISNNSVSESERGIFIVLSGDNRVTGNSVNSNNLCGLQLGGNAERNTIEENSFVKNKDGIFIAYSARYNTVANNIVLNNNKGIYLIGHSDYNEIQENIVCSNSLGFCMESCKENVLSGNIVTNNTDRGILLTESFDNFIYNNYFNNANNVAEDKTNIWNTTKTAGKNIAGGLYLGGNCWASPEENGFSQICQDAEGDGICDSSYQIGDFDSDELALVYSPIADSLIQNKLTISEIAENESKAKGVSIEKEAAEKSPLGSVYPVGVFLIAFLISGGKRNK
ncbi:Cell surface protein [Methanosarcina lacustris Z-7289]|uniref:Cell surface protein n=1 Tax=Methanosarcina lacustris Z-7289 TaxID=1434111 RepID=A0A0E3WTE9_9EURY|nr:NosD domain-containing protein [Methanosarcina lacustris]AKB74500.1 Cell surface protein [Methanosarcina lacustris Z-7289]